MGRILLIEDNVDLAFGLRTNLEVEGHDVEVAGTGPEGLERIRATAPDLVVLDLMLPGLDGYSVLARMRSDGIEVPVLVLTARGEEADKVRGFRLGADDYVTKPFGVLELMARVDALLRRARGVAVPADALVVQFGDVEVDPATRSVRRGDRPVSLRPMEFDLLMALLAREGRVASRAELLREVWGHAAGVQTRTVDTHIAELRRKLEPRPSAPRHILTVWKAGYRLERGELDDQE